MQMIENKILQKYITGEATEEEIAEVVEWLDSHESHLQELISLRKLHNISLLNEPARTPIEKVEKKNFKIKKLLFELSKIAAVFLIFLAGGYFLNKKTEINSQTLFVPPGQRAELLLPDSSIVWLNAQTSITYPTDFGKNNREVELNGEAYFKVKKSKQTFIVKTKDVDIHVLGTEFNVIAYHNTPLTEISLLTGSIELKSPKMPNQGLIMKPNDLVKIKDGKLYSSVINDFDYFRWKEGLLCFNNEPIESIIKKLELYYDTRIEVKKDTLLKFRYTGKFRTKDGIEQILKVLQIEHKFTYTVDKNLNLITIK